MTQKFGPCCSCDRLKFGFELLPELKQPHQQQRLVTLLSQIPAGASGHWILRILDTARILQRFPDLIANHRLCPLPLPVFTCAHCCLTNMSYLDANLRPQMATNYAPLPQSEDEFAQDPRVSFDKATQEWTLEDGPQSWNWLAKWQKWVPIVRKK